MSLKSINCPECGHEHGVPEPGTRKITCESCGMIVVMKKVLGEDWEAQLAAAASSSAGAAPKKKAAPVVKRRRKPAAEESSDGGGKRPTTRGSSRRRPTTRGSSRKRGAAAEPEQSDEVPERRTTGRRPKAKAEVPPALLFGSIIAVIAIAAVLVLTVFNKDDEKDGQSQGNEQAKTQTDAKDAGAGEEQANANDGASGDDAAGEQPAVANGGSSDETTASKKASTKEEEKYSDFNKSPGTTDEEVAAIAKHIETLRDLNATRELGVATTALTTKPKKAMPHLINALMAIKTDDEDDVKRGWQIMQVLQQCRQENEKWDKTFFVPVWPEDAEILSDDNKNRIAARKYWWRWWNDNKDGWKPPVEEEEDW